MIKGHVTIDLHNHRSGFTERIEQDNLVTDAVGILASVYAGADRTSEIMPIAKKALGGLMLFDGALEEDTSNIYFPGNVHLVGFAGQWENTSNPLCGSLNIQETHATDTGYETVWEFSTSQANGTISALALTAAPEGHGKNNPFSVQTRSTINALHNLNRGDLYEITSIANSPEQMAYLIRRESNINSGITTQYDSNRKIYTHKITIGIFKEYVPLKRYKVADPINRADIPVEVKEIELVVESTKTIGNIGDVRAYIKNAYDGYAYIVHSDGNDSGDGHFTYQRIKLSDYSFDVEDPVKVTLPDTSVNGSIKGAAICRGKCFIVGKDTRYIYIVDLANTADIKTADLGEGWWINMSNATTKFITDPGGTVRIRVFDGENTGYAIIYPDGEVIKNAMTGSLTGEECYETVTDSLVAHLGTYSCTIKNYLGTICNLITPITKTAETSMKIIYTLTDEEVV